MSNGVTEPVNVDVDDIPTPRNTDVFVYNGPADATFSPSDLAPNVTGYIFDTDGDISATIPGGDGGNDDGIASGGGTRQARRQ